MFLVVEFIFLLTMAVHAIMQLFFLPEGVTIITFKAALTVQVGMTGLLLFLSAFLWTLKKLEVIKFVEA
jgi:hypothetical protein